jgi:hypothetical protein
LPGYADAMAQLLRDLPDFRQASGAARPRSVKPEAPAAP